jgi:hypothetical protein
MLHPYFMFEHVKVRQDELYAQAERSRLLKSARAARRAARAESAPPRASRSPLASTLASCDPHVAGSAR